MKRATAACSFETCHNVTVLQRRIKCLPQADAYAQATQVSLLQPCRHDNVTGTHTPHCGQFKSNGSTPTPSMRFSNSCSQLALQCTHNVLHYSSCQQHTTLHSSSCSASLLRYITINITRPCSCAAGLPTASRAAALSETCRQSCLHKCTRRTTRLHRTVLLAHSHMRWQHAGTSCCAPVLHYTQAYC